MINNEPVSLSSQEIQSLTGFISHQQRYSISNKSSYAALLFNCFCCNSNRTKVTIKNYQKLQDQMYQVLLNKHIHRDHKLSILQLLKLFPYLKHIKFTEIDEDFMAQNAQNYVNVMMDM